MLGLATGLFLASPTLHNSPVLLAVPAVWLLAWLAGEQPLPRTPLNAALLLVGLMVLVSLYATYDLSISVGKVGGVVLGIAAFFAVVRMGSSARGWLAALLVFLALGAGVALIAVFTAGWTYKIGLLAPVTSRIRALVASYALGETLVSPNEVAGVLLWVLPTWIVLAALVLARGRVLSRAAGLLLGTAGTVLIAGVTLATLAVLVLTQSRSAYIGLAVAGFAVAAAAVSPRRRMIVAGALLLLAAVGGLAVVTGSADQAAIFDDPGVEAAAASAPLQTLEGRVEIWSRALYALGDFPFTGMGMNTFRQVVHVLYPLFLISPDVDIAHAHNEFLQAGLDLGIPGMIAFVALYVVSFWMLRRVGRSARAFALCFKPLSVRLWIPGQGACDGFRAHGTHLCLSFRALALGLGGGLLAHLVYGLTDAVALGARPGVIFWMLLGLITALHALADAREAAPVVSS